MLQNIPYLIVNFHREKIRIYILFQISEKYQFAKKLLILFTISVNIICDKIKLR